METYDCVATSGRGNGGEDWKFLLIIILVISILEAERLLVKQSMSQNLKDVGLCPVCRSAPGVLLFNQYNPCDGCLDINRISNRYILIAPTDPIPNNVKYIFICENGDEYRDTYAVYVKYLNTDVYLRSQFSKIGSGWVDWRKIQVPFDTYLIGDRGEQENTMKVTVNREAVSVTPIKNVVLELTPDEL